MYSTYLVQIGNDIGFEIPEELVGSCRSFNVRMVDGTCILSPSEEISYDKSEYADSDVSQDVITATFDEMAKYLEELRK